jgi:hypothetical protein
MEEVNSQVCSYLKEDFTKSDSLLQSTSDISPASAALRPCLLAYKEWGIYTLG